LGEFVAVNVAHHFDTLIGIIPIIAIFMPLLAGLGGNIGTQSITLMVRGLSTGEVTMSSALHHIFREFRIGLVIGTFFGIMVILLTWRWQHNYALGLVVGFAMILNMTLATLIGTMTPFVLKKINIDPAIASGPVIATTIDVIGLAVYFTLVTIFLKYLI
jgi:magnesium transporter